jgi:CheY-like chemotaxis protein
MTDLYAPPAGTYFHHPPVHTVTPALSRSAVRPAPLILVVDDHEPSRALARLVLEREGYRVEEAGTGGEGLRQAQTLRPALILLDIILPEIDGWTLVRLLREDPRTRDSIVLALTAWTGVGDGARALSLGFEEVLTKPVLPRTLASVVARHLAERPMLHQPAR